MMKHCALIVLLLLAGCDGQKPDATACHDFRVMTYYDNESLPVTQNDWHGPYTAPVCIVSERHIPVQSP